MQLNFTAGVGCLQRGFRAGEPAAYYSDMLIHLMMMAREPSQVVQGAQPQPCYTVAELLCYADEQEVSR